MFGKKHYSGGSLCLGVPVALVYQLNTSNDPAAIERERYAKEKVEEFIKKMTIRAGELFMTRPGATAEQAITDTFREMFGQRKEGGE